RAEAVLSGMTQFMERYPTGFGRYLAAAEFALATVKEIALVGEPHAEDTRALVEAIFGSFLPNKVVLLRAPGEEPPTVPSPLLADRAQIDGKATAYVCEQYTCKLPVTEAGALRDQLGIN
ncbi:MAG TPA: thioredoxin domain-containing protein, partial [Roseiflexaceae bacterium]